MMNSFTFRFLVLIPFLTFATFGFASEGDIDFMGNTNYCVADASGKFPVDQKIIEDKAATPGFSAQGGGCVGRSLKEVWSALQNPSNLNWPNTKPDGAEKMTALPPGASVGFILKYKVDKYAPIHIARWKMEFTYSITRGSLDHPLQIVVRYRKFQGESNIRFWSGIIRLDEVSSGVTVFAIRDQMDATRTGIKDVELTDEFLLEQARKGPGLK